MIELALKPIAERELLAGRERRRSGPTYDDRLRERDADDERGKWSGIPIEPGATQTSGGRSAARLTIQLPAQPAKGAAFASAHCS